MFNATEIVINAFQEHIKDSYLNTYTTLEPSYPGILAYVTRMALELIANSDAQYHDVQHTISVTSVGQEILKGKHLRDGGVTPSDWLQFIISLLCHDIGYVRGVCQGDRDGCYVVDTNGETVSLAPGATDAALTPYHVDRASIFVRERFSDNPSIDVESICRNIAHTEFPVPESTLCTDGTDYPSLLRSADLIGQLADPNYLRKISSLFMEFEETGANVRLGYQSPADLRAAYPQFFWEMVRPHIETGLQYLRMTQQGKQWIANLYAQVFAEEHNLPSFGPERARAWA